MTYALYIDYRSEAMKSYEYMTLMAKNLEEAIEEAEARLHLESEPIYLARIMKKVGKVEKQEDGWKATRFEAILCKRSCGWHRNIEKNGEAKHIAERTAKGQMEFFNAVA